MNRLSLLLILFSFIGIPMCSASELSHPPTFHQMKDASKKNGPYDSAIYDALKYTENDVERLIKENNPIYIIGAAYQYDKLKSISFLKKFFPLIKDNPAGLSLFISCALQKYEQSLNIDFDDLTKRLINIDSENSCGYYFRAYYFAKLNQADECLQYIRKGNSKKTFNNYFAELSNISIKTSLFLGYSEYVAQNYALGLQDDIMIYSGLSKYLTQKMQKPIFTIECLKMGMILRKNSKTLLNDLLSYAVQLRALKKMKGKENDIKTIEREKNESWKILEIAHTIEDTYNIPENRQVEYFNDLYSKSETYAILKLAKEYPVKIQ